MSDYEGVAKLKAKYLTDDLINCGVPKHMWNVLIRYVLFGAPTGDFLYCFLTNDLRGAMLAADDINQKSFCEIFRFLYNCVPSPCHGSLEKVHKWMDDGGMLGRDDENSHNNS